MLTCKTWWLWAKADDSMWERIAADDNDFHQLIRPMAINVGRPGEGETWCGRVLGALSMVRRRQREALEAQRVARLQGLMRREDTHQRNVENYETAVKERKVRVRSYWYRGIPAFCAWLAVLVWLVFFTLRVDHSVAGAGIDWNWMAVFIPLAVAFCCAHIGTPSSCLLRRTA